MTRLSTRFRRRRALKKRSTLLTTNLEAEFARRTARNSAGGIDGARGARVASRFLSETSATFARNRPVLEALGARYRLGVVSNFYGNLEAVCESSGLAPLFGAMADSQRVGAEKPEPAIFQAALSALHAAPETAVMVGDFYVAIMKARGVRVSASFGSRQSTSRPPNAQSRTTAPFSARLSTCRISSTS